MSGGFNNPIIGGGGALVFPSIHSPNYVLGVSGWAINKDGTTQFTGIVIIGSGSIITGAIIRTAASAPLLQLDGPHNAFLIYNALGALIASDAGAAGNDGLGDAFLAGRVAYSAAGATRLAVQLGSGSGVAQAINFYTATGPGGPWTLRDSIGLDPNNNLEITGGVLTLPGGAAPAALTGFATIFGDSSGFLQTIPGATGDSTVYQIGEAVYSNASPQTITPTGIADITGLTQKVDAGTYYFRGIFRLKQGATNVTQNVGFSGPATSACVWYYSDGGQGATTTSQKVVVGSLSLQGIGFAAAADEQYVEFEGTVTFSVQGTFKCQAQAPTAGDDFTIQPGCIFIVRPMQ